jgi:small-conductance mechanosensitive channel
MDYGGLVKRALDIMWKFKYLWIFGFFLEFGTSGGGWVGNSPDKIKLPIGDFIGGDFLEGALLGVVVMLVLAALLVFVVFLILYIISQGGLVHCVWKINQGENPTLRDGWDAGIKNFWRVLGIAIMIIIFAIAAVLVTLLPFILMLIAFKLLGVISGVVLLPIFLVLIFIIMLVDLYAIRTCVIEGKGVFDSLAAGWDMLKSNLGPSLIMALIGIGSTMIYVFGLVAVGLLLILPFIALAALNLFLGIVAGVMVALIYIGLASALWGTYIDSLWTLAYMDMKKLQEQKATA